MSVRCLERRLLQCINLEHQPQEALLKAHSPGTISRRLDDLHRLTFIYYHYGSPKGLVVLKFTMYDGLSDPFDHLMHFQQMMMLDMGNDLLLCKVFFVSLHGPTLCGFTNSSKNSVNSFKDKLEAFVVHCLKLCLTKTKYKHLVEH